MSRHRRRAGGGSTGLHMGGILKKLIDKSPDIIGKAAQGPLGLASLSVLVSGIVGVYLFRDAAGAQKLLAFAMMTGGFLGFLGAQISMKFII
jgi:cation transporter-like permease